VEKLWTLPELVSEVAARIAALPPPRNGQVRAIPDERTIRYYAAIGLVDRPAAMRGRTALYGRRHVAQIVAIKRLQTMGRSLSEIQGIWPTLDARTLARMSGVALEATAAAPARAEFWKRDLRAAPDRSELAADRPEPAADRPEPGADPDHASVQAAASPAEPSAGRPRVEPAGLELRVELAPHVVLSLSVIDESVAISPADVRALRAAAAPLLTELASRRLTSHPGGDEP
jgi:DNA-binding transcriptional MerR regulator